MEKVKKLILCILLRHENLFKEFNKQFHLPNLSFNGLFTSKLEKRVAKF